MTIGSGPNSTPPLSGVDGTPGTRYKNAGKIIKQAKVARDSVKQIKQNGDVDMLFG